MPAASPAGSPVKMVAPYVLFALLVTLIIGLENVAVKSATLFNPPTLIYGAVAFDLAIFLPFLYYVLLARPRRQSVLATVPFVVSGLFVASRIIPTPQQSVLHAGRLLAIPLELITLGGAAGLFFRAARQFRAAGTQSVGDWGERLHASLNAVATADKRAMPVWLHALSDEVIMGYFAFVAWRIPTPVAPPTSFTYHRINNWGGLLGAITFLTLVEVPAEHYLIGLWNKPLAWILAFGSGYSLLWLWADWQAIRLRPIFLGNDTLHLRIGLRWRVQIPRDAIVEVRRVLSHPTRHVPGGHLKAVVWGQPNVRLHLDRPVAARGPVGICRTVRYISLFVDEPEAFVNALQKEMPTYATPSEK